MDIRLAEGPLAEQHANDVPQLVWSTGPIAYEFQFGDYDFYDAFIRESWTSPGTLFSAEVTHFAIDGGQLQLNDRASSDGTAAALTTVAAAVL